MVALRLVTEKPASLLARKHEYASGLSGSRYSAYQELVGTYKMVTDQTAQDKTEQCRLQKGAPWARPNNQLPGIRLHA